MRFRYLVLWVSILGLIMGAYPSAGLSSDAYAFELKSTAFTAGGMIPSPYTCQGKDISPPLAWTGAPDGTKGFALICDDPDAPMGTWVHWVYYNIPLVLITAGGLPENRETGIRGHPRQEQLRRLRLRRTLPALGDSPVLFPALCAGYAADPEARGWEKRYTEGYGGPCPGQDRAHGHIQKEVGKRHSIFLKKP